MRLARNNISSGNGLLSDITKPLPLLRSVLTSNQSVAFNQDRLIGNVTGIYYLQTSVVNISMNNVVS